MTAPTHESRRTETSTHLADGIGRHLLADLFGVAPELLTDERSVITLLIGALENAGFSVLKHCAHKFPGAESGVTGLVLLCESHAAFHTYPEHGYVALDIFSCGPQDSSEVLEQIRNALQPRKTVVLEANRGVAQSEIQMSQSEINSNG